MSFEYASSEVETNITVIGVSGQLNMGDHLAEFETDLRTRIEHGVRKMLVDLSKVSYMDSSGLGTLVVLAGKLDRLGGKLVICGAQGKVREVIEISRVDRLLGMYGDSQAGCAALKAATTSA